MIELKKLRELIKLMVDNELEEVDLLDEKGERITLKRGKQSPEVQFLPPPQPAAAPSPPAPSRAELAAEAAASAAAADSDLLPIKSPMVGTFYAAPSPDSDPFVGAGAAIQSDTVVCLIEAMKVFNEIRAETRGTLERVLVENGETVEFGQTLFLVRPA
jgi:acetyl-CoA carboxylase biotin carboxyl carrier protein